MQYDKVPDLTVPLVQESKYSACHEGAQERDRRSALGVGERARSGWGRDPLRPPGREVMYEWALTRLQGFEVSQSAGGSVLLLCRVFGRYATQESIVKNIGCQAEEFMFFLVLSCLRPLLKSFESVN